MLTVCALLLVLYFMRDSFADNVYSDLRRLLNDALVDEDDERNSRMAMMIAEIHFSYADITMKTMKVSMSATIEQPTYPLRCSYSRVVTLIAGRQVLIFMGNQKIESAIEMLLEPKPE